MKIVPKFLFCFQNVILTIPNKTLHDIQQIINEFIWKRKKAGNKMMLLNQSVREGGVAMPNILSYYYAAGLGNVSQRWRPEKTIY